MARFSIKARIKSFSYAFNGIIFCLKTQHNFWVHLTAMIAVIVLGLILNVSKAEWLLLIFAMGLVLCLEIVNTAIEYIVDLLSPEHKKTAGLAKDLAAGAVLVGAITAALIGLIIFTPKFLILF